MYHGIFTSSVADGNLDNFLSMDITNCAFMNILIQVFWWTCAYVLWDKLRIESCLSMDMLDVSAILDASK